MLYMSCGVSSAMPNLSPQKRTLDYFKNAVDELRDFGSGMELSAWGMRAAYSAPP